MRVFQFSSNLRELQFDMKLILCFLVCFSLRNIHSSPNGAPELQSVCESMTPGHPAEPQTSRSPFNIAVSKISVKGGETIQVELESTDGRDFKGFYLQARTTSGQTQIVGEFLAAQGEQTPFNFRNCGSNSRNAVTHFDNQPKQRIAFDWRAPEDFEGTIIFQ